VILPGFFYCTGKKSSFILAGFFTGKKR